MIIVLFGVILCQAKNVNRTNHRASAADSHPNGIGGRVPDDRASEAAELARPRGGDKIFEHHRFPRTQFRRFVVDVGGRFAPDNTSVRLPGDPRLDRKYWPW